MILRASFNQTHAKQHPIPASAPARSTPYIVSATRRTPQQHRPAQRSMMPARAHHGLKLVSAPLPTSSTIRRFFSGGLDQKHLDRGFLLLAASSALLLLLSSR